VAGVEEVGHRCGARSGGGGLCAEARSNLVETTMPQISRLNPARPKIKSS
jgi:hypothetical protein